MKLRNWPLRFKHVKVKPLVCEARNGGKASFWANELAKRVFTNLIHGPAQNKMKQNRYFCYSRLKLG